MLPVRLVPWAVAVVSTFPEPPAGPTRCLSSGTTCAHGGGCVRGAGNWGGLRSAVRQVAPSGPRVLWKVENVLPEVGLPRPPPAFTHLTRVLRHPSRHRNSSGAAAATAGTAPVGLQGWEGRENVGWLTDSKERAGHAEHGAWVCRHLLRGSGYTPSFARGERASWQSSPTSLLPSCESGLERGSGAGGTGDGYEVSVSSEGRTFFPASRIRLDAEPSMRLCLAQGSVHVC